MFSDIPEIGKCYQQIPTNKLNPTDRNAILLIASQKNGCYIGEKVLAQQVGTTTGNLRKVLGKLVKQGIVVKESKFAYKGRQQRYFVSVAALKELAGERVSIETPLEGLPITDEHKGSREELKGFFKSAYAYPEEHPYRDYKNNKNDIDQRFLFITKDLPEKTRALIDYAPNVSELLDELEREGISLEKVKGALEAANLPNAGKVGGLFITVLQGLVTNRKPTVEKSLEVFQPRKCEGCLESCAFNSLKFNEGYKCVIENSYTWKEMRKRNGLEP